MGGGVLELVVGGAGGRNPEVVLGSHVPRSAPRLLFWGGMETADGLLASGLLLRLASSWPVWPSGSCGKLVVHTPGTSCW